MSRLPSQMTNEQLALIYSYLRGRITRNTLSESLGKMQTNTYYYIGRAAHYWLQKGILKFTGVKSTEDLGGKEVDHGRPK